LQLDKLCGEVISFNPRSALSHERLGFRLEGTRRHHIWRDGQGYDVMLYGLFAKDWQASRSAQFNALFT
jgi:UDP-4-amino-4,6-dideoxy-N-acetyl-beta-L-altrosamine N-acetyltransferase